MSAAALARPKTRDKAIPPPPPRPAGDALTIDTIDYVSERFGQARAIVLMSMIAIGGEFDDEEIPHKPELLARTIKHASSLLSEAEDRWDQERDGCDLYQFESLFYSVFALLHLFNGAAVMDGDTFRFEQDTTVSLLHAIGQGLDKLNGIVQRYPVASNAKGERA
jgi:hypothetical protein